MTSNARAITWMVVAMAAFALSDAMIKLAADHMPVFQAITLIGFGALVIFWVMALMRSDRLASPMFFHRYVMLRNATEAIGFIGFSTALAMAPMVQVVAIGQAVPILVTLAAVVILKENVGARRWFAVCLGLAGVLIMLRPQTGISAGSAIALIGTVGLALRDIFTRLAPAEATLLQLAVWAMIVVTITGTALTAFTTGFAAIPLASLVPLLVATLAGTLAYMAITHSVRMAPVSVVIPFRYTRLLFGTALGIWLFGETIDRTTILGALIVICAGLYILHRERRSTLLHRGKTG